MAETQENQRGKKRYMMLAGICLILFGVIIWIVGFFRVVCLDCDTFDHIFTAIVGLMLVAIGSLSVITSRAQ